MFKRSVLHSLGIPISISAFVTLALYYVSGRNYLLYHYLAEIFSIVIAFGVFMIAWNSRQKGERDPFVLLGIGYLFVALLDTLHALTYDGMSVLNETHDFPTKLWVSARYLQGVTLFLFVWKSRHGKQTRFWLVFVTYATATTALLLAIFTWDIFPLCFEEGSGVTRFKKASEYAISIILLISGIMAYRPKGPFKAPVRRLLVGSIGITILSELSFTVYLSSSGFFNFLGHLLKILSFFLAYRALIAGEVQNRVRTIAELRKARKRVEESEERLIQANAAKDKYISILAHDLRNPFSGVMTLTELITKRFDDLSSDEIRHQIDMAHAGVRQGMDLLDHLLSWGRAQAGMVNSQPIRVNLRGIVDVDIEFVESDAQRKSITILNAIEENVTVFSDPNMLSTILRNLLANAIKFSPLSGTVELGATIQTDHAVVSVADAGIGMNSESVDRLFRVDTHFSTVGTAGESGNGLGLLLCAELVRQIQGRIWVDSAPETGSTFYFTVPLSCRMGASEEH